MRFTIGDLHDSIRHVLMQLHETKGKIDHLEATVKPFFRTAFESKLMLNTIAVMIFGNLLAAQGAALVESFMGGVLGVLSNLLGADTVLHMAASGVTPSAGVSDGSAAIAIIGGADGPTAIFVTSFYDAQALWGMAVKVFSNVVVVVLNYVFSKLIVFKRK